MVRTGRDSFLGLLPGFGKMQTSAQSTAKLSGLQSSRGQRPREEEGGQEDERLVYDGDGRKVTPRSFHHGNGVSVVV